VVGVVRERGSGVAKEEGDFKKVEIDRIRSRCNFREVCD
jgi:hypothetical protein